MDYSMPAGSSHRGLEDDIRAIEMAILQYMEVFHLG